MWYIPLHATKDITVSLFWIVWICFMTFTGAIRTRGSTLFLTPGWVIQWSKQLKCKSSWLEASPSRLDVVSQFLFFNTIVIVQLQGPWDSKVCAGL